MTNESPQENLNYQSDEISLKEIIIKVREWWRFLLSKWGIILTFGILGGALGLTYAYFKKADYIATTTFVLDDEKGSGSLGSLAGLASMAGVNVNDGGGIFESNNILELYKSRRMILQTLLTEVKINDKKESLVERYISFNALRKKWDKKPEIGELQFTSDRIKRGNASLSSNRLRDSIFSEIVMDIANNYLIVAKPNKEVGIIQVDVKSKDEIFAKEFNDAIVKNVNDFYLQTKTKKSLQNVQIIQQKTDSVRSVMNGAIYNAVAVADATPNLNPTRQVQRVAPAQRAQFSAETNKAILTTLVQNLEMSKLSLMKETPLLEVIDQPVFPLKKISLTKGKGIVLGVLIFGFIGIIFLSIKRVIVTILN
ncbi:MAG: lipopolysaccharide biosynthesis protein [Pedobacter sp.]|nr:MAG: lipopolysaccharide biosynthesis protein [Pedobacter sp.]